MADRSFPNVFFQENGIFYFAPDFEGKPQLLLGLGGEAGKDYADDRLNRFILARGSILKNPQDRAIVLSSLDPGEQLGSASEFLTPSQIPPLTAQVNVVSYSNSIYYLSTSDPNHGAAAFHKTNAPYHPVNAGGGTAPVSKIPPSQKFNFCWVI